MAVSANHEGDTYTAKVSTDLDVDLTIGHTIPREAEVSSARLNGEDVRYKARTTNRGKEVLVDEPTTSTQDLVVELQ